MIKIIGDEFGYWSAGAYISGYDWSSVVSNNSYYGYGYGIILAAILKLNLPATYSYQIALVVNAFFLGICYILSQKLVNKYCKRKKLNISFPIRIAIAFCTTVYTGVLSYTQYSMPEVFICMLYWLLLFLAEKLLEELNWINSLCFIAVSLYMFAVHQRLIGVCVVAALFWIFLAWNKKKSFHYWIVSILFAVAMIIAIIGFKTIYQNAFFTSDLGISSGNTNDFSDQVGNIKALFSTTGIRMFIKDVFGKIFYTFSSTFLLAGVSVFICIKKIIGFIAIMRKNKKVELDKDLLLIVFIIANWVIMIIIGSISMLDYSGRLDLLVYGRYMEYSIAPMIMVALLYFLKKEYSSFILISIILVYLILTIAVNYIALYGSSTSNMFINCTGISDILIAQNFRDQGFLLVGIRSVLIFCVAFLLFKISKLYKNVIYVICCIALGFIWIISSNYVYEQGCLKWSKSHENTELSLAENIYSLGIEDSIKYYSAEDAIRVDYMQFLLKDSSIECFDSMDEIITFSEDDYILTIKETEISDELSLAGYSNIGESNQYILWAKE